MKLSWRCHTVKLCIFYRFLTFLSLKSVVHLKFSPSISTKWEAATATNRDISQNTLITKERTPKHVRLRIIAEFIPKRNKFIRI